MEEQTQKTNFTPLVFLASLGAGGIAVMPFVLMQYTIEHGKGLITRGQLWSESLTGPSVLYYYLLEAVMIGFVGIHFILTIYFLTKLVKWLRTEEFGNILHDPLKNSILLAPLISILMTMNVFIGPIRYFLPILSENFQSLFLPAMLFWSALFIFVLYTEIKLLGISFSKGFDINKINFGWLLHPFLLGMLTVVGTGIAAMSQNSTIADSAAFMSLISGSMGIFLLAVKMVVIFKSHFSATGLPEKQFLPSFLIVIPNITLFAIGAFRFGHYLETHQGFELGAYFYLVMGVSFAFEIWYFLFGLSLLKDYFKKDHFKDFYVTQWGFICPLVAFVVLGGFVHKIVLPNPLLYTILAITLMITVVFYFELLAKHIKCARRIKNDLNCKM
ncbi:MAG: selenoprotein TsoY [Patescibacteria group bacterium]